MNLKQQSIQLVAINERNQFYLTSEAKKLLNSIQKPISVITIAGVYRSGKSYLVNRLIKNKQNGFATGSSVEPVTKGLNIWGRPIPAQDEYGNQFVYLVIDSQGIGSYDQEMKYDIKLLMLVFLISSTVIYNSLGAIDELTLDQLRTVVNLKQSLANQDSKEKVKLVWVLRDFALQLINKNGREMSSNDYLEQCLEEVQSSNSDIKKKNEIRRAIKETFEKRFCYTLVRPTIKEEDLRNLDQCRLRTQFLQGIQSIREEVFSGRNEDIKKINKSQLNGKLLLKLLTQCTFTLNSNGVPSIKTIWDSIKQCSDQEAFDAMCNEMKSEINRIALPISKEDLKNKLNDIQNKVYQKIEKQYGGQVQTFKKYHKQFVHLLHKINRDIKRNNAQIQRQRTLKQLREFAKSNIFLQSIQPTNLSLVKNIVDRMQLKSKGQIEGYEYVLSVLFDIMHISEQKALQLQRQANERQKIIDASSFERRNCDINLASLKQDYHQSLKTINNLKHMQESNQKENALCKQKYQMLQINVKNMQQENQIKIQNLIRQLQQANFRARQRVQDASLQTKKLRQEKNELQRQIERLKDEKLREGLNERKEIIFEQKMKQSWDRFEEQRIFFRKELDKYRKQSQANFQKYEQQRRYRQRQCQQFSKDREVLIGKQRQYIQQLQQIKNLHAQTKKTYNATFDALKDSDRIFKNIENVTQSHSKISGVKKLSENIDAVRKHYQEELDKTRNDFQQQIKALNVQLAKANNLNHQQKIKLSDQQSRCRNYMLQKERLQRELLISNQRFSQTVGQIEAAKERQRSLYEDSIVRLLQNLEKREYSSITSSFYKK